MRSTVFALALLGAVALASDEDLGEDYIEFEALDDAFDEDGNEMTTGDDDGAIESMGPNDRLEGRLEFAKFAAEKNKDYRTSTEMRDAEANFDRS